MPLNINVKENGEDEIFNTNKTDFTKSITLVDSETAERKNTDQRLRKLEECTKEIIELLKNNHRQVKIEI